MLFPAILHGRLSEIYWHGGDVMVLTDLRDSKVGMDWYTAAQCWEKPRHRALKSPKFNPFPIRKHPFL